MISFFVGINSFDVGSCDGASSRIWSRPGYGGCVHFGCPAYASTNYMCDASSHDRSLPASETAPCEWRTKTLRDQWTTLCLQGRSVCAFCLAWWLVYALLYKWRCREALGDWTRGRGELEMGVDDEYRRWTPTCNRFAGGENRRVVRGTVIAMAYRKLCILTLCTWIYATCSILECFYCLCAQGHRFSYR